MAAVLVTVIAGTGASTGHLSEREIATGALPLGQSSVVVPTGTVRLPSGRDSRSEKCHARKGLRFYVRRYGEHAVRMGAAVPSRRALQAAMNSDRPGRCPLYLANVWQRKAFAMRQRYERWWAQRGQVIRRLERGVQGTPMAGTGVILERHGRRYGVSPYFIVAVAATESSMGHAACSSNRFNVWGLSSCGSGWYVPQFRSWDEAILFFVRFIDRRFRGHSTPYSFRGYAACSDCWARKVSEWMGRLFGVPARTAYP